MNFVKALSFFYLLWLLCREISRIQLGFLQDPWQFCSRAWCLGGDHWKVELHCTLSPLCKLRSSPYSFSRVIESFNMTVQGFKSKCSKRQRSASLWRTDPAKDTLPNPPYSGGQSNYGFLKWRFIEPQFEGDRVKKTNPTNVTISNPPDFPLSAVMPGRLSLTDFFHSRSWQT